MNSKSSQIVPFLGNVMIPDMPLQYAPLQKGLNFCPFSIHLRNWDSSQTSTIGTLELNNELNGSMTDFTVQNQISEPLALNIIWDNVYNIGPEFGEIRFLVRNDFLNVNLMLDSVPKTRSKPALHGVSFPPRGSQVIHVLWKTGPKYKQLGTNGAPTSLGFLTLLPQRSSCCLFRLPLQLHAVLSHLAISPGDFFVENFNFGRSLFLEIALMNHSQERMHVVARPSLLHNSPVDVTLEPLETRAISVEVKLSARALHDDNSVQESIGFFSPENPSNQASCLFSATVKNDTVYFEDFPVRDLVASIVGEESADALAEAIGTVNYKVGYKASMTTAKDSVYMEMSPKPLELSIPMDEENTMAVSVEVSAADKANYEFETQNLNLKLKAEKVWVNEQEFPIFPVTDLTFEMTKK